MTKEKRKSKTFFANESGTFIRKKSLIAKNHNNFVGSFYSNSTIYSRKLKTQAQIPYFHYTLLSRPAVRKPVNIVSLLSTKQSS